MDLRTLPAFTALQRTSSIWPDVYLPHTDTNRASNRANNIPWVFLFNISFNLKLFKDVNENKRKICIKVLIFQCACINPFYGLEVFLWHPILSILLCLSLKHLWDTDGFFMSSFQRRDFFLSFFLFLSLYFFSYIGITTMLLIAQC